MSAPEIREMRGGSHSANDYAYTAYCSHASTSRGHYDEEIDLIVSGGGRRPGETALRRAAQEILDRDYEPGMRVRRIVRTW